MSATWQAILYGAAVVAFLLAAWVSRKASAAATLVALGLALFTFVAFYNALDAA